MASHHFEHNLIFRKFWQEKNLHPLQIKTEQDMEKVPGMLVSLFKEFDFYSVPSEDIILTLTSSGTGGQKSIQRLDHLLIMSRQQLSKFMSL
jgi:phenylacetate-coenzyme A ligase PaaK-like adenylate-forming protein